MGMQMGQQPMGGMGMNAGMNMQGMQTNQPQRPAGSNPFDGLMMGGAQQQQQQPQFNQGFGTQQPGWP